jgi:RNA polymerase sigma-70 factor, ECF subfamily
MVTTPPRAGASGPTDAQFTGIFREHAPFVWRVLRRLGVAETDVEDASQEVFLVVHRKLGEFEGRSSVRTWIYGICVRVASDHRRRAHLRRERVTDAPPELAFVPRQTSKIQRLEALAALDVALAALDDDKRAVFVLYEIEELSMADVAEAVGCPLQTAYSRLHAARRYVRDALASAAAGRGVTP